MEKVGEHCSNRADQPQNIEPYRGVDRSAYVTTEAKLQQEGGETDCRNDY